MTIEQTQGQPASAPAAVVASLSASSAQTTQALAAQGSANAGNSESTDQRKPATDNSEVKNPDGSDGTATADKVVSENYDFKAPEGVTFDADVLGEFSGVAKELKLSQADAQRVVDVGAKLSQKWQAQQTSAIEKVTAEWVSAATADKEYGGDKLAESLSVAKKAVQAFGTPELSKLLEESRLGNHPEVIRFMVRAGKAISNDSIVVGGSGVSAKSKSTAEVLYS